MPDRSHHVAATTSKFLRSAGIDGIDELLKDLTEVWKDGLGRYISGD